MTIQSSVGEMESSRPGPRMGGNARGRGRLEVVEVRKEEEREAMTCPVYVDVVAR